MMFSKIEEWSEEDTKKRLLYIEEQGYNGVGEFEVRMMLNYIRKLEDRLKDISAVNDL
jgi:hypothetical protein